MKEKNKFFAGVAALSFLLGLLLLPFDTLPYFRGLLREIGGMASFYPLSLGLLASAVLLVSGGKEEPAAPLTQLSFRLAVLFFVWVVVSLAVNWSEISGMAFKGRSGSVKGVLQTLMLAYCLIVSIYAFQSVFFRRCDAARAELFILLSFAVPAVFSLLEVLYLYKLSSGGWLTFLRFFISDDYRLYSRVHSVSGEPSSFAFYCVVLAPWLMAKLVSAGSRRLIPYSLLFCYFVFLVVLTFSKAAYYMLFAGLAVFSALAYLKAESRRRVLLAAAGFVCCFWLFTRVTPGSRGGGTVNSVGLSTLVRLAAQEATFRVANANPVFGVGFAQAGFHMHKFIPAPKTTWPAEVVNWSDNTPGTPWPPSHGLHARIAAETGYPGLLLWLGIWGALGAALARRTLEKSGKEALQGAILCAGVSSCVLMGFNSDTFKYFEYWIVLGLGWAYLQPAGV